MFNTSCQISQNAILLQETRAGHSWQSGIHDPHLPPSHPLHTPHPTHWASGVGSAEDITARKANQAPRAQHNTHGGAVGARTDFGGRQQSPCHLRLRPAHVRPATPHTQLSGPRPPWCHTAASHRLPESYFSSAEQTQKSVCPRRRRGKNVLISWYCGTMLSFFRVLFLRWWRGWQQGGFSWAKLGSWQQGPEVFWSLSNK